jgi:thiamine pyrophosphate-dependent acetolactate synthase large subunit-like protein
MAADAYGRVSKTPGVCLVTAGPGFTNALTGVAGAHMSNAPFIIISGRSGVEENDKLSLQEIDQQAMVKPVTKWARNVYDISRIPEYISLAYNKAVTARPGPVYLGMSYEVLYPSIKKSEAKKLDQLAADLGLDRGALLKQLIRRGYKNLLVERALEEYREGRISLSGAAELAEINMRDLLLHLPDKSIELNYDLRELQRDIEGL